jgi:hypothetical protein
MPVGIADVATLLVRVLVRRCQEFSASGDPFRVHGLDVGDPDVEEAADPVRIGWRLQGDRRLVVGRTSAGIDDNKAVGERDVDRRRAAGRTAWSPRRRRGRRSGPGPAGCCRRRRGTGRNRCVCWSSEACCRVAAVSLSLLASANGQVVPERHCSPVTRGGAQKPVFGSCPGTMWHPAVPGRLSGGRLACCCLQWETWLLLTSRSSGWSSACAMPGCGCTGSGCVGRTRRPVSFAVGQPVDWSPAFTLAKEDIQIYKVGRRYEGVPFLS